MHKSEFSNRSFNSVEEFVLTYRAFSSWALACYENHPRDLARVMLQWLMTSQAEMITELLDTVNAKRWNDEALTNAAEQLLIAARKVEDARCLH